MKEYASLIYSVQSSATGPTTHSDSLIHQPAGIYRFIFMIRDGYGFSSASAQLIMDSTTIDPIPSFPTSAAMHF